jgi:hypothetical protein
VLAPPASCASAARRVDGIASPTISPTSGASETPRHISISDRARGQRPRRRAQKTATARAENAARAQGAIAWSRVWTRPTASAGRPAAADPTGGGSASSRAPATTSAAGAGAASRVPVMSTPVSQTAARSVAPRGWSASTRRASASPSNANRAPSCATARTKIERGGLGRTWPRDRRDGAGRDGGAREWLSIRRRSEHPQRAGLRRNRAARRLRLGDPEHQRPTHQRTRSGCLRRRRAPFLARRRVGCGSSRHGRRRSPGAHPVSTKTT